MNSVKVHESTDECELKDKEIVEHLEISKEQHKKYEEIVNNLIKELYDKPFPIKELQFFIDELKIDEKRLFCSKLLKNLPINKSLKLKGARIVTLLRIKLKKPDDRQDLYILLYSLLKEIYINYRMNDNDSIIIEDELEIRERYGDWHYYFALILSPFSNEIIHNRAETILQELKGNLPINNIQEDVAIIKNERSKESELLQQERKLRVELKEQNDKLQVQVKQLQQQNEASIELEKKLNRKVAELQQQIQNMDELKEELTKSYQEVTSSLHRSSKEISRLQKENSILTHSQTQIDEMNKEIDEPELDIAYSLFYQAIRKETSQIMSGMVHDVTRIDSLSERNKVQEFLKMLTELERFYQDVLSNEWNVNIDHHVNVPASISESDEVSAIDVEKVPTTNDARLGRFYRYNHGGRIDFEDGETTNITESIVNSVGLQHNAVVECKAKEEGGYYFNLILQGDDELSEVSQFIGYVKYLSDGSAACVDVNSNEEYPLHFRDVDHWNVLHGDTGTFNVQEGNNIARISRIYKDEKVQSINSKYKQIRKDKSSSLNKDATPFLEGCTIVIVGGVEKWFSDTVALTGATLIHNTGYQPQRVYNDIKKANAVFLLLSANSHNATWGAIEVAKRHQVPHFNIQGSRSNLLSLLWEHRSEIRQQG